MKKDKVVLAYHSIGKVPHGEVGAELYCVPVAKFKQQMEYVAEVTRLQGHKVTITFDDGDITSYIHAFPLLKKFGLKAYFFILVSKIGMYGYMDWNRIKELNEAGMFIGSHGMTHRILVGLKDKDLDYELGVSKELLEHNLGGVVDSLSIPRGFCNRKIIEKAGDAGYRTIFTSDDRISVKSDWNIARFRKVLNDGYPLKDRAFGAIKTVSQKILGIRNYDMVRTIILSRER